LPFGPSLLASVSAPCPYPSCLCLPLRDSFSSLSIIFSPRGHHCIVSSGFAYLHCSWRPTLSIHGNLFHHITLSHGNLPRIKLIYDKKRKIFARISMFN
jgi:hypothetical protein